PGLEQRAHRVAAELVVVEPLRRDQCPRVRRALPVRVRRLAVHPGQPDRRPQPRQDLRGGSIMRLLFIDVLLSLPLVGAYAMFGLGIVVTYQASRVLNLAHGAMAMF